MFNNVPVSGKWVGQHSLITSQWCTRAQLLLNIALCIGHQLLFSQTQKSHAFSILQAAVMCLLSGETCFCPYSQHFSYTDRLFFWKALSVLPRKCIVSYMFGCPVWLGWAAPGLLFHILFLNDKTCWALATLCIILTFTDINCCPRHPEQS